MKMFKSGSREKKAANPDYFTGTVWQEPIIEAPAPARLRALLVTFEPSARTAWHTHPLGQTIYITAGVGRVQIAGGPVQDIHAGDTVWFPPGVKHWHGAAPDRSMTHIAMQEALDGKQADWLEKVSDEEYGE